MSRTTGVKRVLLFGLDGMGWSVLKPLIEENKTPFLANLVQGGASGTLLSPWPGSTFPSWTSIMTGTTPGVHGMLDFTELDPRSYRIRFIDSRAREVPSIWELATRVGRRCAVLGVPGTYPPDRNVEMMISGFDTPVTTSIDPSFVWPPRWHKRLSNHVGLFPLTPVQELRIGRGWHRQAWNALQESIEGKVRVAEFVLRDVKPDLFVLVFGESDTVCHHFWQFADPASPRASEDVDPELSKAIQDIVIRLDRALEHLHAVAGNDVLTLVVSDHGFGGAGVEAVFVNRYLERLGFLQFKKRRRRIHPIGELSIRAAQVLPRDWQQWFFRRLSGTLIPWTESRRRFQGINWERTVGYSEELNYAPSVRLNLRGREGKGVVDPAEYHDVRHRIREALLAWQDPVHGDRVVNQVWYREELLRGPALSKAPDLLLELRAPGGYSYIVLPSGGMPGRAQERLEGEGLSGAKGRGMNGSHRREGILIARGPGIRGGIRDGLISAEQVAALALLGLGVDIPAWIAPPPPWLPNYQRGDIPAGPAEKRGDLATGDRALEWERARRLRGLGYLG
jgi:predicted AlkP superfamily phosphohydrolase/phosphomutase